MHDGLALLSELNDSDISAILESSQEQQVIANEVIIKEGTHPENLYVVLSGLVGIYVSSVGERRLATLGPGELLGEISYIEDSTASATVMAIENSLLLVLSRMSLDARMAEDPFFASRLNKSFALISSRRLRERVNTLGRLLKGKSAEEKAVEDRWGLIAKALDAFKELMQMIDRESIKRDGVIPNELALQVPQRLMAFVAVLNKEIGKGSPEDPLIKDTLGARAQREFLPYLLLTRIGERMYAKPRGYAGDYLTIEWMYRDEPEGSGRIGPLLDRAMLESPAIRAVKNRRRLLAAEISRLCCKNNGETIKVTSLGCGPAREIFDVFDKLDNPSRLRVNMIDIDLQALAYVSDRIEKRKLKRQITLLHCNLIYLATGRQKTDIRDQNLVYSVGLIDYFDDKFVVKLLNYIYAILAPGGKVILGNFHSSNPCRAFCDYVLDWKLIHRTEEDMNCLYSASRFGRVCTNIRFEGAGINLFAECVKESKTR